MYTHVSVIKGGYSETLKRATTETNRKRDKFATQLNTSICLKTSTPIG